MSLKLSFDKSDITVRLVTIDNPVVRDAVGSCNEIDIPAIQFF